ncbi:3-deoxy-7-phosphoheptulonate synthase [Streptomyces sp. GMY02]|uniref:3-deoxy-7-phosphoheptulonate synthase n=1 Tax=Streptomyces sp. GMY02 TaxID=1333528 RepID=UPI001C2C1FFC|nr:3-deoxy-7-phosphoheptulonate synthase [Streptomyces sp. GMY02]QXE33240.1 3-deoxy-7-phosphoheptulonate synthase [Streptomyces sp. GMY02]
MRRDPLPSAWESLPAQQQPEWDAHPLHAAVLGRLRNAAPLVTHAEAATLGQGLAEVALGRARVVQAGDCAESFYESGAAHTAAKVAAIDALADRMAALAGQSVLRIGRIAGQYAKPRSAPVEVVDGVKLPVFRGHMVNQETVSELARRPDPRRMVWAYHASAEILSDLRARRRAAADGGRLGPWSSHEALVLDYEAGLVRHDPVSGRSLLGSTHFPWIGERTRQLDHAHVALLAAVGNPVGCKIGPSTDPDTLLGLCAALDPDRVPGRLTLIFRMGRDMVAGALPPLVRAVVSAGHPVVWMSDPMHGNTRRAAGGVKTRYLADLVAESREFRRVVEGAGRHVGGLHLEVAAEHVTECVGRHGDESALTERYRTLCDPRLTVEQASELIDATF